MEPLLFVWSSWSTWSACPVACNGGKQVRQRSCRSRDQAGLLLQSSNVLAQFNASGFSCFGASAEQRRCNQQLCPVFRVSSIWTQWYGLSKAVNEEEALKSTIGPRMQRRFRVECLGRVPEADRLNAKVHRETRWCRAKQNSMESSCQNTETGEQTNKQPEMETSPTTANMGTLSNKTTDFGENRQAWSAWTTCSRACDGGIRWRTRPSHRIRQQQQQPMRPSAVHINRRPRDTSSSETMSYSPAQKRTLQALESSDELETPIETDLLQDLSQTEIMEEACNLHPCIGEA
ncbi:unnamed protein product [Protopolystoma xenopodis]|uniref:Sema5A/B-like TSP-1 type 1 domain-containing protein n=1 Tax=Protopolystoma xenopodis TaxID=117903 RepID=A0A448WDF8_9PLAT|nr:unnamed protein product [Protopolystoma xenopodis]